MRYVLAESENFAVLHEYESVFLKFKHSEREVLIGDFYGDPEAALISENESFCAVGGCGVIVYFLKEPFTNYQYNFQSEQWFELNRQVDNNMWVLGIKSGIKSSSIILEVESKSGERFEMYELDVYTKDLTKLKE